MNSPINPSLRPGQILGILLVAFLLSAPFAFAHDPGFSTLQLNERSDHLEVELQFSAGDAAAYLPEADRNHDGKIDRNELGEDQTSVASNMGEWVKFRAEESPDEAIELSTSRLEREGETGDLVWHGTVVVAATGTWILELPHLDRLPPGHRQYVTVKTSDGVTLTEALLSARNDRLAIVWSEPASVAQPTSAPLTEAPAPSPSRAPESGSRFLAFFKLGVEHILIGYDHLLFLAGLLIASRRWQQTLGIITSFTIAHSITLGLAATEIITLPGAWVEPLIAASIVYVGIENILRRHDEPKARWLLTFCFGLVHGFGFASVLRELGLGSGDTGIVAPLFGFNIGVEFGQFAVAAVILPILAWARQRDRFQTWVSPAFSCAIVMMGGFWLVERTLM